MKNILTLALFVAALFPKITAASAYDRRVLRDRPMLYLPLSVPFGTLKERNATRWGSLASYLPANKPPGKTKLPNGDVATVFDGLSQYVQYPSSAALSVPRTGALTFEAWLRPDTLQFPKQEGDGYVYWAGKGESGQHEYAGRMYSLNNSANRPNRVSGYVFNLAGGLGSGSYFQEALQAGTWMHVVVVIDDRTSDGTIAIYKNGVLRKSTPISQFDVMPEAGNAPVRIASRDLHSFFKGAIGKFAVYGYALTAGQVSAHYQEMY